MPSLPPFLLARLAFRNHMTKKPKRKTGHILSGSKSRACLSKLYRHEFMGPDKMHSQVIKKLADVIARPLLITVGWLW